jgi:hypothetical protein
LYFVPEFSDVDIHDGDFGGGDLVEAGTVASGIPRPLKGRLFLKAFGIAKAIP